MRMNFVRDVIAKIAVLSYDKETQEEYRIDKYIVVDGYDVLIYIAENEYEPLVLTQYFTGESMTEMLDRHGMELV